MSASLAPSTKTVTSPAEFVSEVLAYAERAGLRLVVESIDVRFRFYWQWVAIDGDVPGERVEVMSVNRDEVKLRACLAICRSHGWPIAYEMGRNIHLDIEPVPKREDLATVPAATLRGAGAYVPPHVRDYEEIEVAG